MADRRRRTVICLGQGEPARESQRQSALALEQEGKVAEAEAEWRSLLSSQPNDAEAYAHLGLLEARQEHYKEAIVLYHKALSLNPKMPSLRLNLGLSYFKAGDLPAAIQTFEPLLKSEPKSSPEALRLVTLIGLAHYGMGEYAAAIPYLKQATAADPENLPFRLSLAQSCLRTKQYQCVLDVYREILTLNAESAEADMLAGEAYDELKNDAGALAEFQAAVKAGPKTPDVHFGYGYLLWRVLKFDEAEKAFRSELANNPEHRSRVSLSRRYGDTAQSIRTKQCHTLSTLCGSNRRLQSHISIWALSTKARDAGMTLSENSRRRKGSAPATRRFIGVWDGFINPSVEQRKRRPNLTKRATCNKRRNNHFESSCTRSKPSRLDRMSIANPGDRRSAGSSPQRACAASGFRSSYPLCFQRGIAE